MKKLILFIVNFILLGCNTHYSSEVRPYQTNYQTFINRSDLGLYSKSIFQLGVEKILPSKEVNGQITLEFVGTTKEFVNGSLNMSSYIFHQKKTNDSYILSLENTDNPNKSLNLTFNPSSRTYIYKGQIVSIRELLEQEFQFAIMAVVFDELNNTSNEFTTMSITDYRKNYHLVHSNNSNGLNNLRGTSKMCEMSAIGIDYTRSGAKGHSYNAAASFINNNPGTIVTGHDQGCVWEDFLCVYVISMIYPCPME